MGHRVVLTRRRHPASAAPGTSRRARVAAALTAAGVRATGPAVTYEWTQGSPAHLAFGRAALEAGHREWTGGEWPCDLDLEDFGEVLLRQGAEGVYRLPGGLVAYVGIAHGWANARVAAASREAASAAMSALRERYPPIYRQPEPGGASSVPITFWTYGQYGPQSRLRMIESATWEAVEANYAGAVRDELARLTAPDFEPGRDGQLFLWYGPPGTGKTWALRALASEWRDWAEFSYITDPDRFFGDHPDYMIDVLLHDSYEELAAPDPDGDAEVVTSQRDGKWRVLILEDTGELLSADAKEREGQGLSRLLNVVDGMVGQGLRVLAIVTTNDEIERMHPAVVRPGRCASQVEFGPLSADEASALLGSDADGPMTLAEVYQQRGRAEAAFPERDHPDDPEPEDARDLMASVTAGAAVATSDKGREVAAVAERHAPDGGYGDTAWRASDGTVFWVCADWTSNEEHEAAVADFMAVEGVEAVEHEAEAALPDGDGWEVVWRSAAPVDEEAALADVVALAARPLRLAPEPASPAPVVLEPADALTAAALAGIRDAHERTLAAVSGLALARRGQDAELALTASALEVARAAAERPIPAPHFNVHVAPADVRIEQAPARIDVHVPEQPAPVVHVAPAEAARVDVHVPEQPPAVVHVAAPHVEVAAAEIPAPVIHLNVPPPAERPPEAPRSIRVEYDDDGTKRFIVENEEEVAS